MLQQLVARLEESGIKPSVQRIKIFEYFLEHDNHPTAEKIYQDLQSDVPVLSKATVYNTLGLFLEKGLIKYTRSERNEARYDLADKVHGHFICQECKEIYDFPYQFLETYTGLDGFKIQSEEIVIKGICKQCLGRKK